ncbi:MAG: membrane protein insertion efficiency factor YidD [Pseudomonadota bacterium]
MRFLILLLIDFYRSVVRPVLPPACRFAPTCSEYTRQAVSKYGAARGLYLSVRRLARCHPFAPGGLDPLP